MNLLPFGDLPPHRKRTFVPEKVDPGNWDQLAPLFDKLETRAPVLSNVAELERWLLDWSELSAAWMRRGSSVTSR